MEISYCIPRWYIYIKYNSFSLFFIYYYFAPQLWLEIKLQLVINPKQHY